MPSEVTMGSFSSVNVESINENIKDRNEVGNQYKSADNPMFELTQKTLLKQLSNSGTNPSSEHKDDLIISDSKLEEKKIKSKNKD